MKLLFVTVIIPLLVQTLALAEATPSEKKLIDACYDKGDCDPIQAYLVKLNKPQAAAVYAKTGCEDFKKAKDCVTYAVDIGNRGFDEIGIAYLKTACKFDSKTCPSIELIKCLMKAKSDGKGTPGAEDCRKEHPYSFTDN